MFKNFVHSYLGQRYLHKDIGIQDNEKAKETKSQKSIVKKLSLIYRRIRQDLIKIC